MLENCGCHCFLYDKELYVDSWGRCVYVSSGHSSQENVISLEGGQLSGPVQPWHPSPSLLSLCRFTDCRPTAGSPVDVEGQVNKSRASYAKLIKQRSNCAALAHPHMHRHTDIDTECAHMHAHTWRTNTYMHLHPPVINLTVTLGPRRYVTDVCVCFSMFTGC